MVGPDAGCAGAAGCSDPAGMIVRHGSGRCFARQRRNADLNGDLTEEFRRSGHANRSILSSPIEIEPDLLRPIVQHASSDLGQLIGAFDDREEVISGERSRAACERHLSVRDQQLRLADSTRIPQQLARLRRARRVLHADAELEGAEWDPAPFAAPAAVHEALCEGEQSSEGGTRRRGRTVLEAREEAEAIADRDCDTGAHRRNVWPPSREPTDTAHARTELHSWSIAEPRPSDGGAR